MEETLKRILADIFNVSISEINEEISMQNFSMWDSLRHMQIIAAIEENFEIPMLSMDEIISMTSYSAIMAVLSKKIGQ